MKLFILFLLLTGSMQAQTTRYTLYDCTTFRALYTGYFDIQPECSTTALVTENWAKPTYNPACNCFFNNATQAEQDAYILQQYLDGIPWDAMQTTNPLINTPQTSATLNSLYPGRPIDFEVRAPNVGTGMIYYKVSETQWTASATSKI